ncbi:MAG: hypothetical protein QM770_19190 [Tepidisphaeraceae bacterium]
MADFWELQWDFLFEASGVRRDIDEIHVISLGGKCRFGDLLVGGANVTGSQKSEHIFMRTS